MKNSIIRILLLFWLLPGTMLLLTGCPFGSDDKSSSGMDPHGVNMNVFNVVPTELSTNEARADISEENEFYDNEPNDVNDVIDEDCMFETMGNDSSTAVADGFYEFNLMNIDLTPCAAGMEEALPGVSVTLHASITAKMKMLDEAGTALDLSGVTITGEGAEGLFPVQNYLILKMIMTMTMVMDSTINANLTAYFLNSSTTDGDAPCVTDDTRIESNCSIRTTMSTSGHSQGEPLNETELGIFSKNNLMTSSAGTYYTQGTMNFTMNNWTGLMTYDPSNTRTPPSFTATNGTETIAGFHTGRLTAISAAKSGVKSNLKNGLGSISGQLKSGAVKVLNP